MTPAQAKKERAELLKAIAREEKIKDRSRLVELRGRARALRRARATAIAEARRQCAARRRAVPTLREAAAMLRAARAEARATCDAAKAKAGALKSEAQRAAAEREAESAHQRTMRRLERHARERAGEARPRLAKARVRREESDDEVRGNIPPELVFLFERVKRQIKGSARRTRTEAFLDYAHEHPDEELAALEDKTDALIRELEARERRANGAPWWSVRMRWHDGSMTASVRARTEAEAKRAARQLALDRRTDPPSRTTAKRVAQPKRKKTALERDLREGAAKVAASRTNPRRPPAAWWDECIARVTAGGRVSGRRVRVPRAVCGAAWWNLSPHKRGAIVRKLERSSDARSRGAAVALARAEKAHRRRNPGACCDAPDRRQNPPREVVSLVYLEQKPSDREPFEYEHEFEGERPKLEMRGGKAQLRGGTYTTRNGWLEG